MDQAVRKISVTTKFGPYTVSVGSGILDSLSKRIPALACRKRIFLLTSPEIWALWGPRMQASLSPREPIVLFLPSGERHKRMSQVERLTTEMTRAGADRSALLIAFGGGITGDVGGFVSAIYMRGIDCIRCRRPCWPGRPLSGRQDRVKLQTGKNLVGCFYPPQAWSRISNCSAPYRNRNCRPGFLKATQGWAYPRSSLFPSLRAIAKPSTRAILHHSKRWSPPPYGSRPR